MAKVDAAQCDMCGFTVEDYYSRVKWGRLSFQPDCGLPVESSKDLCPECVAKIKALLKAVN